MRKAVLALLFILSGPALAEETAPKTYDEGVCAGYHFATNQVAQSRQQLLAIIAGSRSEAIGLLLTMMDNVIFAQLDASKVTETQIDCGAKK